MKAFPSSVKDSGKPHDYFHGMDLRDYFAAKAMPAIVAENSGEISNESIAIIAYAMADAMMKEREKS
jgi:hypothetical protein